MNTLKKYLALSAAIIAISFTTTNALEASNVDRRPERTLEQQIYRKLIYLPYYNVFDHITFQLNGDTVVLNGKVNSLGTKRDAASAIKNLPGVGKVINNIEELPPSPYDNRIRREALLTFASHGPGQYFSEINPDVRIIVENGRITLEGYVWQSGDSNLLNVLANGISGVFSVQNNLVVGRDAMR